jgi:hypothetical protein
VSAKHIKRVYIFYRVYYGVSYGTSALSQMTSFFPEYFKAKFAASLIFKMASIQPKIDSFGKQGLQPVRLLINNLAVIYSGTRGSSHFQRRHIHLSIAARPIGAG